MVVIFRQGGVEDMEKLRQVQQSMTKTTGFGIDPPTYTMMRGARLFIAQIDGEPVGFGVVRKLTLDNAELSHIGVLAKHEGTGIGKELTRRLEAVARNEFGCKKIIAVPAKRPTRRNQTAQSTFARNKRFFAKRGYKPDTVGFDSLVKKFRKRRLR